MSGDIKACLLASPIVALAGCYGGDIIYVAVEWLVILGRGLGY